MCLTQEMRDKPPQMYTQMCNMQVSFLIELSTPQVIRFECMVNEWLQSQV